MYTKKKIATIFVPWGGRAHRKNSTKPWTRSSRLIETNRQIADIHGKKKKRLKINKRQ